MPESFDELVGKARDEFAVEQEHNTLLEQQQWAAQEAAEQQQQEKLAIIAAARREAQTVAATMQTNRVQGIAAITPETSAQASKATSIKPVKAPPAYRSPRSIRKGLEKSRRIQQAGSFTVWDLETSWMKETGSGEDSSRETFRNYLGANGMIYHSRHSTDEGYVIVRTLGETDFDLQRFTSVREGLARLVARNHLAVDL